MKILKRGLYQIGWHQNFATI